MPSLQWGDYQEKQPDVLKDIEKAFSNSLFVGLQLSDSLAKINYSIDTIAGKRTDTISDYETGLKNVSSGFTKFANLIVNGNEASKKKDAAHGVWIV